MSMLIAYVIQERFELRSKAAGNASLACNELVTSRERVFLRVSKEAIETRALPALFGGDTPRRSLRRLSLAKPTSAPLRF